MADNFLSKRKKAIIIVAVVAVVACGCFAAGILWSGSKNTEPVISSTTLEQKLTTISEVATVNYGYTNMGKFESQSDFYGWKVPLTKKVFIIAYDGEIKAGVDMSKAKVDMKNDKIKIIIPKAEILSHTINDDSIEVFDESKNIFNPISITDYTQFSIDQKYKMEAKALDGDLLNEAQLRASEAVEKLIYILGIDENNEIDITFQKSE